MPFPLFLQNKIFINYFRKLFQKMFRIILLFILDTLDKLWPWPPPQKKSWIRPSVGRLYGRGHTCRKGGGGGIVRHTDTLWAEGGGGACTRCAAPPLDTPLANYTLRRLANPSQNVQISDGVEPPLNPPTGSLASRGWRAAAALHNGHAAPSNIHSTLWQNIE